MSNQKSKSSSSIETKLYMIIGIALFAVFLVISVYLYHFNDSFSSEQADWGAFGDFIGGVLNPALSFLALIALLYTIILQQKELAYTREELSRSADELERSAKAQESSQKALNKQSEILRRQQFEQTFFSLLEEHNSALNNIKTEKFNTNSKNTILEQVWENIFSYSDLLDIGTAKKKLGYTNNVCGHYFRILYQLLKFIAVNIEGSKVGLNFDAESLKHSKLVDNEKMYSNIIRSFLDHKTLQVLAINCCCTDSSDSYWKYRLLIERYEFLEHMPINDYKPLKEAIKIYDQSVFGKKEF